MSPIFYDNFEVTVMRGKTRQINHYYPYGLRINSIDGHPEDYKNMYTSKELQTGEFDPSMSTGFEMYDFHARFYDPQLGRWFTPDPAEQFSNPYLAMGNNPVMYVDPDGEFIMPMLIGAGISVITNGISNSIDGKGFFENAGKAAIIGGISGAFAFGIGEAVTGFSTLGKIAAQTVAHGHLGGMATSISGGDYYSGFASGAAGSLVAGGVGLATNGVQSNFLKASAVIGGGALAGGLGAEITGGDFWDGARNGAISSGLNHLAHMAFGPGDPPGVKSMGKGPVFEGSLEDWLNKLNNMGKRLWVTPDGYQVYIDDAGNIVGFAPMSGMPEWIGPPLKKGEKVVNVGKYALSNRYIHRVLKPKVLNKLNVKDYGRFVGTNPELRFEGTKIFLQGSPLGPFRGQTYHTQLNIFDFIF